MKQTPPSLKKESNAPPRVGDAWVHLQLPRLRWIRFAKIGLAKIALPKNRVAEVKRFCRIAGAEIARHINRGCLPLAGARFCGLSWTSKTHASKSPSLNPPRL
jgi:hypothetical protein